MPGNPDIGCGAARPFSCRPHVRRRDGPRQNRFSGHTGTASLHIPCKNRHLAAGFQSEYERRQRDQAEVPRLFRDPRPHRGAVVAAGPAQRPDPDVHQCRDGAVQERLHRPREAPLHAGGDRAEMRARRRQAQRPRQCRLHRAPPHVFRDARQLLVRRLFQGPRHRARLEPGHQGFRPAQGSPDRHRLCRRRPGVQALEEDRRAARREDHPHRRLRQFLADGRLRSLRPVLGNLLRSRPAHSRRASGLARRRRRPLHRDLESRVHAVRAACRWQARRPAEALDRHRHGARAHRRGAAGHARQLQDRPVSARSSARSPT